MEHHYHFEGRTADKKANRNAGLSPVRMDNGEGRPEMVTLAFWLRESVHPTQLGNWHSGSAPVPLNDVFSLIEELIGTELEMVHEEPVRDDPDRTGGDTSLMGSDVGWKARWSLHDGLQALINWLARPGPRRA